MGPSLTPAVVNDLTNRSCSLSAKRWQLLAILRRRLKNFFLVLAALQPPICCSNTTANTFQWVRPRPRRSSKILQNVHAFKSKEPPTVMKTKDNRNKPHHSEHLSIWFSQSVQHRTKCIMNTELRHLHFQRYDLAIFTNTALNLNHQTLNSTKFFFWRGKKTKDIYAGAANRAGTLKNQRAACCSSSNKAAAWAAWAFGAGACSWLALAWPWASQLAC